ncbi:helix-turn-helix domain-containing protein [Puteibacter caeruleilacunae]|nr:helix-turn-helix domain-containing protein [Puteibacter caeruleilacunae]
MKTQRKFSSEFKAKVALEALKERESITELAKKYDLHPNQITTWKKDFISNASSIFESGTKKKTEESDHEKEKLYQAIGQLKVENDFLKKALS